MIRCCRHIKPDGTRCQSPALAGQPFCYQHDRLHHASRTKSGRKNQLTLRPLEDRGTVLMALSDVICGLAAGKIDPNTAARLIYGLQVASQVTADFPLLVLGKPVESVDFTKTGDEMAPAVLLCTEDDHCESCPDAAGCSLKKAVKYRAEHGIVASQQEDNEGEEDTDEEDNQQDSEEVEGDGEDEDTEEEDDGDADDDEDDNEDEEDADADNNADDNDDEQEEDEEDAQQSAA